MVSVLQYSARDPSLSLMLHSDVGIEVMQDSSRSADRNHEKDAQGKREQRCEQNKPLLFLEHIPFRKDGS